MPEIFQKTFDVPLGTEIYTFRIPGIQYDIESAYKSGEVRSKAYPRSGGELSAAIDMRAVNSSRGAAILELYLVKATVGWPFGIEDDANLVNIDWTKPPEIKYENFPFNRADDVLTIGQLFETEIARFRNRRNTNRPPVGQEGVAGVGDPGTS